MTEPGLYLQERGLHGGKCIRARGQAWDLADKKRVQYECEFRNSTNTWFFMDIQFLAPL